MPVPVVCRVIPMVQKMIRQKNTGMSGKFYLILISVILLSSRSVTINAQNKPEIKEGTVTYVSGENIYVRFESTSGIENGDTLFKVTEGKYFPVLIVHHLSSISCLCNPLGKEFILNTGDKINARTKIFPEATIVEKRQEEEEPQKDISLEIVETLPERTEKTTKSPDFAGRLSVSSYSNFSSVSGMENHRLRYSLNAKGTNISGTRFSAETYFLFSHTSGAWDVVNQNLFNALKIYNLSFQYDFGESLSLWAGRRINPKLANVGAIDGIQAEYKTRAFYAGMAAGFRPDYIDFGFNSGLPEFGFYIGHSKNTKQGYLQTSLALFEQRNHAETDRRFLYFQHNSAPLSRLNIFSSFEMDLYKLEDGKHKTTLYPVSFYSSINYRVSKKISLSGSYDNRKNVMYYETFRNYSEEIFHQASRQGMRLRINYRPVNFLTVSGHAGTRYKKGDLQPANTFYGNISWSDFPLIRGTVAFSGNILQTSYLNGEIFGGRIMKEFLKGKITSMIYYRYADFNYTKSASTLQQHIGEIDFSWQINKNWDMSVNFESILQKKDIFSQIYLSMRLKI